MIALYLLTGVAGGMIGGYFVFLITFKVTERRSRGQR